MATPQKSFDFLETYIQQLFDDSGFGSLAEDVRAKYVTMFTAEAEKRLGIALLPMLSQAQADELMQLAEADATAEQYGEFWQRSIPDFENQVKKVLTDFATEFKSLVG